MRLPIFLLSVLFPLQLFAASAEMIITPTRLVLDDGERFATVSIKNPGDAIGRYRIEVVDATMQENGGVKMLEKGERDPFSATDMLRISPRSTTLKPGQFQAVRMLVKQPKDLQDGEYRSHLKIRLEETNIDPTTNKPVVIEGGISIKPKLNMVIPIIVRVGETSATTAITSAEFKKSDESYEAPRVSLALSLEGNQSVIGDFYVTHITNGSSTRLKKHAGVAIYRGTPVRLIDIPLDEPPIGGELLVEYKGHAKDGAEKPTLASYRLSL